MDDGGSPAEAGRIGVFHRIAPTTAEIAQKNGPSVDGMRRLAVRATAPIVGHMSTVTEIEAALEKLPPAQQREIVHWLEERLVGEESPEMLAALDVGIRSLEERGAREFTRTELEQKVRQWAGASR